MSQTVPPDGNPLTTIFTPPPGCYQTQPAKWTSCISTYTSGSSTIGPICYQTLLPSCYPTGAYPEYASVGSIPYLAKLHYSPAVLPSGYHTVEVLNDRRLVLGCPIGYTPSDQDNYFCASAANGQWRDRDGNSHSGQFDAWLPHVQVTWKPSELNLFTPASAPALASSVLASYEAAARDDGLSTGAQAGIGVGVALAALILIAGIIFLVFRRRRRRRVESGEKGYFDSKAELPAESTTTKVERDAAAAVQSEGHGSEAGGWAVHEMQHQADKPPPIPVASKPRFSAGSLNGMQELPGHFQGYEVGSTDARAT